MGAGVSLVWDCGVANAVRLPEVLSWAKLRLALLDLPFVAHSSSCSSHVSRLGFFHSVQRFWAMVFLLLNLSQWVLRGS